MQYITRFHNLIEKERKAEIERCTKEMTTLTAQERRNLGRCEFFFKGHKEAPIFQYHVIKFIKPGLIRTKIGVGDLVLISRGNPLESDLTGTVTQSGGATITVAFECVPPKWAYRNHIRIDLYSNDIAHKRMQENLQWFAKIKHPLKSLLLHQRDPYPSNEIEFEPMNQHLNASQKQAIGKALGTRDCFLIHGPPGTGKTTTLVELIYQASIRGKRILATAESNTAADNMLMKLAQYEGLNIVRIGHPARILDGYEAFSLYAHLQQHPLYEKLQAKLGMVKDLKSAQKKFQKPTPKFRRGLSDEEICQHGRKGRGARGVKCRVMCEMYGWIKREHQISAKVKTVKDMEKQMYEDIIQGADVVIATNCMAGCEKMFDQYFDLAVIDEGSQQVEPSSLIPLLKARRFIMAGDDKQLPPTVISPDAQELQNTLFERLKFAFPQKVAMLTVQYRMHNDILAYSKKAFYDDKLVSGTGVGNHTLQDILPLEFNDNMDFDIQNPIEFRDTSSEGDLAYEHKREKSVSYENALESVWVQNVIMSAFGVGLKAEHIGVITPYQGQVQRLKRMLSETDVEVDSIDGFQGREKEMIILSLVRANSDHQVGFLNDIRRLNVAITRAKRKLVIVGHGETLKEHPVYKDWLSTI